MTTITVTLNPEVASLADGTHTYTASRFGSPPQPIAARYIPDGPWSIRLRQDDTGTWVATAVRPFTDDGDAFVVAESNDCAAAYFAALDWANAGPDGRVTVPTLTSAAA